MVKAGSIGRSSHVKGTVVSLTVVVINFNYLLIINFDITYTR